MTPEALAPTLTSIINELLQKNSDDIEFLTRARSRSLQKIEVTDIDDKAHVFSQLKKLDSINKKFDPLLVKLHEDKKVLETLVLPNGAYVIRTQLEEIINQSEQPATQVTLMMSKTRDFLMQKDLDNDIPLQDVNISIYEKMAESLAEELPDQLKPASMLTEETTNSETEEDSGIGMTEETPEAPLAETPMERDLETTRQVIFG